MAGPHVTRHECLCQKHFHPTIHLLSVKMATQTWPCTRESRVALIPLKFTDFDDTVRFLETVSRLNIIGVSPNTVGMNGSSSGVASSLSCITSNIKMFPKFLNVRLRRVHTFRRRCHKLRSISEGVLICICIFSVVPTHLWSGSSSSDLKLLVRSLLHISRVVRGQG